MTNFQNRVLKACYNTEKKWFICISFAKPKNENNLEFRIDHRITFNILRDNYYIEWIPGSGPITIVEKSDALNNEKNNNDYIFDFNKGRDNWAQGICSKRELNWNAVNGYFDSIFRVMEEFLRD